MNKRNLILGILISIFVISLFVSANSKTVGLSEDDSIFLDDKNLDAFFFFGTGCYSCTKVEPFIDEIEEKYTLNVHRFDIYSNRSLLSVFEEYCNEFNLPIEDSAVPTIFVSDSYFVGDSDILEGFEDAIKDALKNEEFSNTDLLTKEEQSPHQKIASTVNNPSILTLTTVALSSISGP